MTALRDFVADLMERRGAAVETVEPDGLAVVAPPEVRTALGWPELARLSFGAETRAGARRIGIEGEWLERFGALLDVHGRYAQRQMTCDPPPVLGNPERLLSHALDLPNAVWRFQGQRPACRSPVPLDRFPDRGRVRREAWKHPLGRVQPGHRRSLRRRSAPAAAGVVGRRSSAGSGSGGDRGRGAGLDAAKLEGRVRPALDAGVRGELAPFLRSMQRRLARDHARLHGYHDDLRRDSLKRRVALEGVEGPKADADRRREDQRIAAIEREYRSKLGDLRHNYALRVTVDWIQTLELFVPVQRLEVLIRRRKGERVIHLDWHPLVRLAEPPPCDWDSAFSPHA